MPERTGTGFTDMGKKKIIWIELLRIAACIAVVMIHAASQHFRDIPIDTSTWKVSNFYHGFFRYAVPCFIMISGALYLDKKRTWNLKKLWMKNILPIAAAYIFWQLFYGVYRILITGSAPVGSVRFLKKLLIYFSDSYFHLWYLPMLMGLMILAPLIWEIVNCSRGKRWEEYAILLFLIFKIAVYTITVFPLPWSEHIKTLLTTVQPTLVTDYAGYFVLGHYLYTYGLPKKMERAVYFIGTVLILTGIALCQWRSLNLDKPIQAFYDNYTLATFFWSSAVFLFFKNCIGRIRWSEKQERIICYLGSCTFGVYLIHAFFRDILHRLGFDSMTISNTAAAIPLVALAILLLSFIAVAVIKVIPAAKKWIV